MINKIVKQNKALLFIRICKTIWYSLNIYFYFLGIESVFASFAKERKHHNIISYKYENSLEKYLYFWVIYSFIYVEESIGF